jgi:GMP synthase (glutamine-hydrolysing)
MPSPRVLVIQHDLDDALNDLANPLVDAGLTIDTWCTWLDTEPPYALDDFSGVISMGAVASVLNVDSKPWIANEIALLQEALAQSIPILGVCFGSQILATAAGGSVRKGEFAEIGWCDVTMTPDAKTDPLFKVFSPIFVGMQFHYDTFDLPENARVLATAQGMIQGYRIGPNAWATQFHIEANPSIVHGWLGTYRSEIDAQGVNIDSLRSTTEQYWRKHREISTNFGAAFARVVRNYASA